jgi:phage tail-like protein
MSDDASAQSTTAWPLPKFRFEVSWDGAAHHFQEVSGLDLESQVIAYRAGGSPTFQPIKMPGILKSGSITLKRGVFKSDNSLWDWFDQVKMNTLVRKTMTIRLLEESGAPTMAWTLANAWPTKVTGTDLKSDGNEVALESVEIAYEALMLATG